jgi:hypothetical protein
MLNYVIQAEEGFRLRERGRKGKMSSTEQVHEEDEVLSHVESVTQTSDNVLNLARVFSTFLTKNPRPELRISPKI